MNAERESGILERRSVTAGGAIITAGEFGNCAYLIQSGRVRVYVEQDGRHIELAQLGAGQIFGEMALVFDGPRTAHVVAIEDCNLVLITRKLLKQKMDKSDPTIRALLTMLMERLLGANNNMLHHGMSVEALTHAVTTIYENMQTGLSAPQRRTLQNAVLPKMEEFLQAVRAFAEKYHDDSPNA